MASTNNPNSNTTKVRLRRLFAADARSVLIALDPPAGAGAGVRLREPGWVLREIDGAGVDGVLLHAELLELCVASLGRTTVVLSHPRDRGAEPGGVELALRLGADAIKVEARPDSLDQLTALAADCERWGMPLVAEMLPLGVDAQDPDTRTPAQLGEVARLGAELGADVVLTRYTGDRDSFAELVARVGAPVVALGGADGDLRQLFTQVRHAVDAGAAGVVIGRGVWSSDKPGHIAGALVRLVHGGVSVDVAFTDVTRVFVGPGW